MTESLRVAEGGDPEAGGEEPEEVTEGDSEEDSA